MWKAIIRPPRAKYTVSELGPAEFNLHDGLHIVRSDFEITGHRNHKMVCSHFEPRE
jgi:hypothetical protein